MPTSRFADVGLQRSRAMQHQECPSFEARSRRWAGCYSNPSGKSMFTAATPRLRGACLKVLSRA